MVFQRTQPHRPDPHPWGRRLLALLALLNLVLVFFNLSYVSSRDVYLQVVPGLTRLYDPIKGIQPHPETEHYLKRVEALEAQVAKMGLQSPLVAQQLTELRQLSQRLIQDNAFAAADKNQTLGEIQAAIRQQTGEGFSRDGFNQFWSQAYLTQVGWSQAMAFWHARLRPLIETNYDRGMDRFGRPTDYFWLLDLPFVLIFALDLGVRTVHLKRKHPQLRWLEALLRHWYDLFLLLPFWRWLRVIPVSYRLYSVGFLNLEPVQAQVHREFVIGFAADLIEMVGIQTINQVQASVKRGEAIDRLLHPEAYPPEIQVSPRDEVRAIATRLVDVSVYEVLPQLQPDLEDWLRHNVSRTLDQLPAYRQLRQLPGMAHFPAQFTTMVVEALTQFTYHNLVNTLEDPVGAEITARLSRNFRDTLEAELKKNQNLQVIQELLVDWLEEIKLNYVRGIAEIGIDQLVEEAEQLHRRSSTHAKLSPAIAKHFNSKPER